MTKKKICIAGKNEIALYGLQILLKKFDAEQLLVCPNKMTDEPSWQPDLARYANHYGVTVSGLEDLYRIKDLVFISLEFDKIINPKKFLSDELYNVHFSLLPAYKGVYTSYWPIMNGEVKSGVTIHKIEKGIDTGDILFQKQFELPDTFTSRDLYQST